MARPAAGMARPAAAMARPVAEPARRPAETATLAAAVSRPAAATARPTGLARRVGGMARRVAARPGSAAATPHRRVARARAAAVTGALVREPVPPAGPAHPVPAAQARHRRVLVPAHPAVRHAPIPRARSMRRAALPDRPSPARRRAPNRGPSGPPNLGRSSKSAVTAGRMPSMPGHRAATRARARRHAAPYGCMACMPWMPPWATRPAACAA